jgi:hypothetical protein
VLGGSGDDWVDGGAQFDRCFGGDGRDHHSSCEVRRGLP